MRIDTDSAIADALRRATPKSRAAYHRAIERRNHRRAMASVQVPIEKRLRAWMDANELNAKEVAHRSGYHVTLIWRTLRGGTLGHQARRDLDQLIARNPRPLGARLLQWMGEHRKTRIDVARASGYASRTIARVLAGHAMAAETRRDLEQLIGGGA